jgi:hypothetical protein
VTTSNPTQHQPSQAGTIGADMTPSPASFRVMPTADVAHAVTVALADRTAPKGTLAFHAWRGQALTAASARRELWRIHHQHSTKWLRAQLAMHEFHLSDYCRPYRSDNLRLVSRWYVRMISTELRNRGASA